MKHLLSLACALALAISSYSQITFGGSYIPTSNTSQVVLIKLHQSGYKYLVTNQQALTIKLYNTNHTLWKTIAIPAQNTPIETVWYVSENLFDTDNQIEYLLNEFAGPSPNAPNTYTAKVIIYNEDGTILFSKDSVQALGTTNDGVFEKTDGVFDDGTGAKMKLGRYDASPFDYIFDAFDIYNLPGTVPCDICGTQTVSTTGLAKNQVNNSNAAAFFPNPASEQIQLKYQLPSEYNKAFIRIQDAQGKVLESYEVTSDFSTILVPASYQNGLYLYTLEVDGQIIKTEKIIVSK